VDVHCRSMLYKDSVIAKHFVDICEAGRIYYAAVVEVG
jgi:hypothetical protein